jgi:ActR/RegA family two-component response regulator
MHQPPLRGRPIFVGKKVLLIDPHQLTRDVRASVLLSRGIEVHVAESLSAARCLWRPKLYDWILLDMRRYLPEEALAFCEQISDAGPRERFAFLVGPPKYLSLAWPNEFRAGESGSQQWSETVHRFVAAA